MEVRDDVPSGQSPSQRWRAQRRLVLGRARVTATEARVVVRFVT